MNSQAHRTVYLETFGCQMNALDSELVTAQLRAAGYRFTDRRDHADVVLYNTCSVREQAENKVFSRIGEMRLVKQDRPHVVLGILGCLSERDGQAMLRRYPQVDLICGPGELDKVPLLIDNAVKTRAPQAALQGNTSRRSSTLAAAADSLEMLDLSRSFSPEDHRGSAYVRITRGCNKFCTYCVVPFTRGAEIHRPPDHIVEECKRLADAGVIEVTLLGQTVNHYRYDHGAAVSLNGLQQPQIGPGLKAFREPHASPGRRVTTFADLLKRIHDEVPAIQRLRFVTSFPRDFGDDILQVMADSPRICRYLHIPPQSGSNRMLQLMNRGYTVEEYRAFIERCRHYLPDVQLAGDIIVGFPTETEEDHQATADLLRWTRFKNCFVFKYSPRPGTVAIDRFPDDIPDEIKRRRNNELLAIQSEISLEIHRSCVGRTVHVMVEGVSAKARKQHGNVTLGWEKETTQLTGRTDGDLIVIFDGDASLAGSIVPVRIQQAMPLTLFGELATEPIPAGS